MVVMDASEVAFESTRRVSDEYLASEKEKDFMITCSVSDAIETSQSQKSSQNSVNFIRPMRMFLWSDECL